MTGGWVGLGLGLLVVGGAAVGGGVRGPWLTAVPAEDTGEKQDKKKSFALCPKTPINA